MNDMAFITKLTNANQRPHYWVRFAKTVKGKIILISHKRFYWHEFEGGQEEALFWAQDWRNWEYQRLLSVKGSSPLLACSNHFFYFCQSTRKCSVIFKSLLNSLNDTADGAIVIDIKMQTYLFQGIPSNFSR